MTAIEKKCENCKHQECNAEIYPCYRCAESGRNGFKPKEELKKPIIDKVITKIVDKDVIDRASMGTCKYDFWAGFGFLRDENLLDLLTPLEFEALKTRKADFIAFRLEYD